MEGNVEIPTNSANSLSSVFTILTQWAQITKKLYYKFFHQIWLSLSYIPKDKLCKKNFEIEQGVPEIWGSKNVRNDSTYEERRNREFQFTLTVTV